MLDTWCSNTCQTHNLGADRKSPLLVSGAYDLQFPKNVEQKHWKFERRNMELQSVEMRMSGGGHCRWKRWNWTFQTDSVTTLNMHLTGFWKRGSPSKSNASLVKWTFEHDDNFQNVLDLISSQKIVHLTWTTKIGTFRFGSCDFLSLWPESNCQIVSFRFIRSRV